MLDTKLKNLRRTKNLIILSIVLIPAILIVSLYPQMEKAVNQRQKEYADYHEEAMRMYEEAEHQWELQPSFVHMATEASFCLYSELLGTSTNSFVDQSVLMEYGWYDDTQVIKDRTVYYVSYDANKEPIVSTNASWNMAEFLTASDVERWMMIDEYHPGSAGYLILNFDVAGNPGLVEVSMRDFIQTDDSYNQLVLGSIEQYKENASYWEEYKNLEWNGDLLIPKNIQAVYILKDIADFGWNYMPSLYEPDIFVYYMETGAWFPVLMGVIFVALAALLLPFIKKLETGWEKLFSLPFEVICFFGIGGILGGMGMLYVMSMSSMTSFAYFMDQQVVGMAVSQEMLLNVLLAANVIGWALCFFMEYIVVASFRQFLCGPLYYLKQRVLSIRLLRWIKRQFMFFLRAFCTIDLDKKLHFGIVKFVAINGLLAMVLCLLHWIGIIAAILYSILLYIFLKKYGRMVQKWYQNILLATRQMAEGNLRFQMDEDMGIFKELGEELSSVQKGFSKAVIEEARSQNMKTELITNVSHDLKTPLTAIVTYVDLLKKENLSDEERTSYVNILDQKSQRLKVLIEDLFEVSKAASGNIQMNFMDVDIVSLMKEVRLEMEEKLSDCDLNFKWNLPEEKIILSLDGQKTYRVFENLLNNTIKYSLPHSRVYVDIVSNETDVHIVFRNISAQELPEDVTRLTERFVRGDASRQTEGSGLGLAIAKSFVELQHGTFDISMDGDLFKVSMMWRK